MRNKLVLSLACLSMQNIFAIPGQVTIVSQSETANFYTLNPQGQERAAALAYQLGTANNIETNEFGPPVAIFASRGSITVLKTATPLSSLLNIPIHVGFSPLHPEEIVNYIFNNSAYDDENVMIFWDAAGIPSLIGAFGFQPVTSVAPYITFILQFPMTSPYVTRQLQLLFYNAPTVLPPY